MRGTKLAIGLGSNLGDRAASLTAAVAALRPILREFRVSRVYESLPLEVLNQPDFLNACCVGRTRLTARQSLSWLKDLERRMGRGASGMRYGPRVIDLDLLLVGDDVIAEPDLVVPHPRMRERAFVLVPLAELVPDWKVPASGGSPEATVAELAASVETSGVERTTIRLQPVP